MRWFKHMTASAQDEKLAALQDQCGLAGYGFFWRVLELIANQVDESGKNYCSYSKQTWCRMLAINHQTWSKMIASCRQLGIFIVSENEQTIKVESPNILKYRDEWTRKKGKNSGVTPERLRSKEQIQNTDTEDSLRSSSCPGSDEPDEASVKKTKAKTAKKPPEPFLEDSPAYKLAVYMRDTLKANIPTLKEPDLQSWAREFDVSLRNDDRMREPRFVAEVIRWIAHDSFWRTNCQCPATLRKQFDKLTARMAEEAAKARASPARASPHGKPTLREVIGNNAGSSLQVMEKLHGNKSYGYSGEAISD